jgi:archaellum component FlaC
MRAEVHKTEAETELVEVRTKIETETYISNLTAEMMFLRSEFSKAIRKVAEFEALIGEMQISSDNQISELKRLHALEIIELKRLAAEDLAKQLSELRRLHELEIADLRRTYEAKISELLVRFERAGEELKGKKE